MCWGWGRSQTLASTAYNRRHTCQVHHVHAGRVLAGTCLYQSRHDYISSPSIWLQLVWLGFHHPSAAPEVHNLLGYVSATLHQCWPACTTRVCMALGEEGSFGRIIGRWKERVGWEWESKRRGWELNGVRVNAPFLLIWGLFPGDAILEVNGESQVCSMVEAITRIAPDSGGGGSHHKSVWSSLVLQRIGTFINYCMCNNTVCINVRYVNKLHIIIKLWGNM